MRSIRASVCCLLLLSACGEETRPTAPVATGTSPTEEVADSPAVVAAPEASAPEVPTSIDLLHAVASSISVSSAYNDSLDQVGRLADGNPETAWNSASEDLVGSWIEFAVPAGAQVTSIELTAGFTRVQGERDLFAGNHRIRAVRVTREGEELGNFPLDIQSQTLQSLPVSGPGGRYRIELTELEPGSHASWREACVSELRVLGTMEGAAAGTHTPRFVIGSDEDELAEPQEFTEDGELVEDDGDEGDDEYEGDDAYDEGDADPSAPFLGTAEGITLTELTIASDVQDRQPVDPRARFTRGVDDRIFCLLRLENPGRTASSLELRWEQLDHPSDTPGRSMNVPASPRYVTWQYTGTRARPGNYRCAVYTTGGTLIGSAPYEIVD